MICSKFTFLQSYGLSLAYDNKAPVNVGIVLNNDKMNYPALSRSYTCMKWTNVGIGSDYWQVKAKLSWPMDNINQDFLSSSLLD